MYLKLNYGIIYLMPLYLINKGENGGKNNPLGIGVKEASVCIQPKRTQLIFPSSLINGYALWNFNKNKQRKRSRIGEIFYWITSSENLKKYTV